MQSTNPQSIIENAISIVDEKSPQTTDGKWLEGLTALVCPHIREWDISRAYTWSEWPEREQRFPGTTNQDVGIDVVAIRRSDGEHIAIQCKSRQLDKHGRGEPIHKHETDKFANPSAGGLWAERWIVTNGDNPLSNNAQQALSMTDKPIKMVNIASDLRQQQAMFTDEECPHCEPNPDGEERHQTITCMQNEAVVQSIRILREHEQVESGGLPAGQARGKLILPCGTGKTRVSLRIVEELTPSGELAIVLCPSIALVAQIRREYLQNAEQNIRALAVCSDETAGYDPRKEGSRNTTDDPTVDNSNVSAAEVKGKVTTDPAEIAQWIRGRQGAGQISVIFGTYQSGHRIAEALDKTQVTATVLIADEAHRTAGLRRKRNAKNEPLSEEEIRIRDFTLCHDNDAFPARYRVYQTATPRIYDTSKVNRDQPSDWIVRTMDDETVFGVELYRKSYTEAVKSRWLADYRIIALGINDPDAFKQANHLAANTESKGRHALTSTHYLRGLAFALAMGGATQGEEDGNVPIKSCIAFMNTVDKSKNMAQDLTHQHVRKWLQGWLRDNRDGQIAAEYSLEHLDATSNVTARDNAKRRLAESTDTSPHGIINVGIFGEGTDAPSLSAVGFLEARKSPIDVIQAVGRAMRIAPGKSTGYIICPILIPPNADPETWLSTSNMDEGWQELGQILLALRAHDQRIEDNLADLLQLYVPKPPEVQRTIVAVAGGEDKRISYRLHQGAPGEAQEAVERVLAGESTQAQEFSPISEAETLAPSTADGAVAASHGPGGVIPYHSAEIGQTVEPRIITGHDKPTAPYGIEPTLIVPGEGEPTASHDIEPTQIISGKKNDDGSFELRLDTVARTKPAPDGTRGAVDIAKSKAKAKDMINKGAGIRLPLSSAQKPPRRTHQEIAEQSAMRMLRLSGMEEHGNAIRMNLLVKSGLIDNRVVRDLNILESGIKEAAHHLRNDDLQPTLDRHFRLDNLKDDKRKEQADGCTIAALLMMNAGMLHQRIANGHWFTGVSDLETVKNDVNVVRRVTREWNAIMRHDFRPVLEPAVEAIEAVEDTGKLAGLERALRHIAAEAERIAETYADMGADHAGPLFNRVMGNQTSDGAFFTRPVAASIAARLTLDACGDVDWTDPEAQRTHKIVDLACGSGTLLAAMLADMKRRSREQGADETQLTALQKLAVEETIKGLDINPVSLQLAAAQLTAGNHNISYRKMGLHLMPYGPHQDNPSRVDVGTLELLRQRAIVARHDELAFADDRIASQSISLRPDDVELEDAVDAVKGARIFIMNPPFTNRTKMGEKFPQAIQQALRSRVDTMEGILVRSDNSMEDFTDKNSIRPLFAALAERCLDNETGMMTTVLPTIALTATSGQQERSILAERFHIHTVLTCHQPRQLNMSQGRTDAHESIVVMRRHPIGVNPPTRFIQLDRMPVDESEVEDLHRCLRECHLGRMSDGWGEVFNWPVERMEAGDWTPAIWRSPELAKAASRYAHEDSTLQPIGGQLAGRLVHATGQLLRGSFEPAAAGALGSFPILKSKGSDGQTRIQSQPDEYWIPKNRDEDLLARNGGNHPEVSKILDKAGHLLITASQNSATARIVATAGGEKYVGNSWMPVTGLTPDEAKATSVFLNSTPGRLQIMSNPGKALVFPTYSAAQAANIRIPNIKDTRVRDILSDCWEHTKDIEVPQFRDGECEVRRLWDEAVADAMGWDPEELARLRNLLHQEPHVRGLGYNQYADEAEEYEDEEIESSLYT